MLLHSIGGQYAGLQRQLSGRVKGKYLDERIYMISVTFFEQKKIKIFPEKSETPKNLEAKQESRLNEPPVKPKSPDQHNAVIFSLKNQVMGLVRALRVFQVCNFFSKRSLFDVSL